MTNDTPNTRARETTAACAPTNAAERHTNEDARLRELSAVLKAAASLAVAEKVPVQTFVAAAYQAYLTASPALREEVETYQFLRQVDSLRRVGRVGDA